MFLIAERIARRRVLEAHDRADIARADLGDVLPLVGVHLHETAHALLLVLGGVIHIGTGGQRTRIAAEVRKGADERIGSDLERKTCKRLVVRGLSLLFLTRLGIDPLHVIDVQRAGKKTDDGIEQELHALVLVGGTAEHGHRLHLQAAFPEACDDLLLRQFHRFEVFFHQLVVGGGSLLHELVAVLLGKLHHVLGNGLLPEVLAEVVIVDLRFHRNQVDDATEGIFLADGQLHGHGIGAQALADHLFDAEKVRAVDVHLVDVGDAGHLIGVRLAPHRLGLRLHAALGAECRHGAVQNAQRTLDFHCKVHVAGRVDDVETIALPDTGGGGGRNGDAALLFLDHPVHGRGALVDFAQLVRLARVEQNALAGRRLAGVDVRHDPEISCML